MNHSLFFTLNTSNKIVPSAPPQHAICNRNLSKVPKLASFPPICKYFAETAAKLRETTGVAYTNVKANLQ